MKTLEEIEERIQEIQTEEVDKAWKEIQDMDVPQQILLLGLLADHVAKGIFESD